MPYEKPELNTTVSLEDIKPEHHPADLVGIAKAHQLSNAGFHTKLQIREADEGMLVEAIQNCTKDDIAKLKAWRKLPKAGKGLELIALKYLATRVEVNGDKESVTAYPGDLLTTDVYPEEKLEELLQSADRSVEWGIRPCVKVRE